MVNDRFSIKDNFSIKIPNMKAFNFFEQFSGTKKCKCKVRQQKYRKKSLSSEWINCCLKWKNSQLLPLIPKTELKEYCTWLSTPGKEPNAKRLFLDKPEMANCLRNVGIFLCLFPASNIWASLMSFQLSALCPLKSLYAWHEKQALGKLIT